MTVYTSPDNYHHFRESKIRVVGLHGFAQSGKDTVAMGLAKYGYERVALADPIRDIALKINPVIQVDSYGRTFRLDEVIDNLGWDDAKVTIPEVRRLLQVLGTEVGRDLLGPNVWVNMALAKIADRSKFWVVTDVRFPNEVEMIRKFNDATLVKIVRPGVTSVNQHVSDKGLPDSDFDSIIVNDGTIDELWEKVYRVILRENRP